MSPMFLAQFIAVPLSATFNVLERQDLQLWWDIGRLVYVVASLLLAQRLGLSGTVAVALYSTVMFAGYVLLFSLSIWVLQIHQRQ